MMDILALINEAQQQGVLLFEKDGKLGFKVVKGKVFAPDLKKKIGQHKDAIVKQLQSAKSKGESAIAKRDVPFDKPMPLSFSQQRLWFIDRLNPGNPDYNVPTSLWVHGHLDITLAQQAISTIIKRHEVLRTVYRLENGEPVQQVQSEHHFTLQVEDFSHLSEDSLESEVTQWVNHNALLPFDLTKAPVVRANYLSLNPGADKRTGVLLFNMHHIASDGWSRGVLVREFVELYQALQYGNADPLPPLEVQYGDFALWQREHLSGEKLQQQLDYWQSQFEQLPQVHGLPLDKPRPSHKQSVGARVTHKLDSAVVVKLNQLAEQFSITPFVLLHGILSLLLSRHSNSNDIVIGTAVANRRQKSLDGLIGFFVNTLVLRADTNHQNLASYFDHIKTVNRNAQSNQDVPFEQLVEKMQVNRSTAHSPLFQIMFSMNNNERSGLSIAGVEFEALYSDAVVAKFDLDIAVNVFEGEMTVDWVYDVALFHQATVERLARHFDALLYGLIENSDTDFSQLPLSHLPMMNDDELERITDYLDVSINENDQNARIEQRFNEAVERFGDHIALVDGEEQLTYAELATQANRLSHYLMAQGLKAGQRVGLAMHRSNEMVIGMLAILQCGASYVPLDPNYPQERLAHMVGDSGIGLILSHREIAAQMAFDGVQTIALDSVAGEVNACADSQVSVEALDNSAYVIYTSGTTGLPKGVVGVHQGVIRLVNDPHFTQLDENTRFLHSSSISFDAAVLEIWGPLLNGGRVVMYPEPYLESKALNQLIAEQGISTLWLTAGFFIQWSRSLEDAGDFNSLKCVMAGGDVVDPSAVARVQQAQSHIQIVNGYGPTENTTFTTCHVVEGAVAQDKSLPIGRAVNGTGLCVLDAQQQLVPMGCVGELYTSGLGLAQGYLNQPELTEEKFPTININGQATRLYRTGDLVRFNESGELEFVGRADSQVKVRGFRIELGEVKRLIDAVQGVTSSLIITTGESADDKRLVAYVESALELDVLRSALTENLPKHMMPSVIIPIDEWPLTSNGKIDRKALPQPDSETLSSQVAYQAPANDDEKALVFIWSTLLSVDSDKLSTTANFFDLGGHSLSAVRLSDELHKHFGKEVPVKLVFDNPTIVQLSQAISTQSAADNRPVIEPVARDGQAMPLSFAQQRLWLVDQLGGGSAEYNMPLAFEISGAFNPDIAEQAFKRIIERHEVLRTVYAKGPEGEPVQVIRDQFEFNLIQLQVTDQSELKQLVLEDARKPFDLSIDVMLRASWAQTEAQKGVLLFNMHHIASDGWSMPVLMREFTEQYKAIEAGKDSQLAPLKVQYADYAQWQRNWLKGETLDKQMDYWQSQLEDVPSVHSLPLDKARPEVKQFVGARAFAELPADVAKSLQQVARKHQLTPFMLMHGALAIVLSRHSGTTDIVVGTPSANRGQSELSDLIGFFVNTLVLRVNTDHKQLSDYFTHVRQTHLDAQTHQDVPFEQLVDTVGATRSTAYTPLFQIMLTTDNDFALATNGDSEAIDGLSMQPFDSDAVAAKFDLEFGLTMSDEGIRIRCNCDVSLFSKETIDQLNRHLCQVLKSLASNELVETQQVQMLDETELTELTSYLEFNTEQGQNARIEQRFNEAAERFGDHIALINGAEQLTYAEVANQANRLSHYLMAQGLKAGQRVGLAMHRSNEMVVGMLAILQCGASYVPLDPNYPQERLAHMVGDSGIGLILSHREIAQQMVFEDVQTIALDRVSAEVNACSDELVSVEASDDSAYVIYTSGTTGLPKGVVGVHQGVIRLVNDPHFTQLDENTRFLHSSSISFDAAVLEIWGPLLNGGRVVMYPEPYLESKVLNQLIAEQGISTLWLTAGFFIQWSRSLEDAGDLSSLKCVMAGGDVVDPSAVARVQQSQSHIQIVNGYGPTENTTFTTCHVVEGKVAQDKSLPIGRAVNGTGLCVLDTQQQLVPMGCVGELYTSGLGLAQGYLNQPELTEEKFPTININGQATRLYRTGDLVRFNESGELEFVGRADSQVKVRGFRIELGEVKRLIDAVQGVTSSLIITTGESADDKRLVAYVESALELDSLRSALTENLPKHMMPSVIIPMEEWPLTANGKIDRKALPQPDGETLSSQVAYQAPANDDEKALVSIWSALLSVDSDKLSTTANFFDLGGHSLSAVRLSDELHKHFGKEVPVKLVFDNPTIVQLSQAIAAQSAADNRPAIEPVARDGQAMPLSFAQQRLWLVDQLGGGSSEYNMPLAFEISGTFNPDIAEQAFKRIIERHEVLRTVYAKGSEGEPVQVIRDQFEFGLKRLQVTDQSELKQLVLEDARKPFDLSNDVMLRASWVQTEAQKGVLLFNMHHIASDGWSMPVLMREFTAQYKAIEAGKDSQLAPLKVQYADYAQWQRNWLKGETLDKQMDYWQSQLEDVPSVHSLPLDKARPEVKQFVGARAFAELPVDVAKSLQQVARKHQLTPFMLMHGALAIVLSRHSGTTDIVVGTPSANRGQSELSDLIGFFVNTLVLRVNTDHKQLSDYFTHVRQTHLDAQTHQDVPFEQLADTVGATRSTAYTPLFQIMLTTDNDFALATSGDSDAIDGLSMQPSDSDAVAAKFDLDFGLTMSDEGIRIRCNYDVSLFSKKTIDQLNGHLCQVLKSLASNELLETQQVQMLDETELTELTRYLEFNAEYGQNARIEQRFNEAVERFGDHIALVDGEEQLTYAEVANQANRLSHYLMAQGLKAGQRVGLAMHRSNDMVVGMLAILQCGASYVPLDPSYPQERLAHMVGDSGIGLILSHREITAQMVFDGVQTIALDKVASEVENCSDSRVSVEVPDNSAYVIYTSGTTGLPKGVVGVHQGVIRLVNDPHFTQLDESTRFLHSSSISFDAAVLEIWGPLLNGGRVVMYPEPYLESKALNQLIAEQGISTLWLTAGFFIQWSRSLEDAGDLSSLKCVMAGGDVVDPSAVARVQQSQSHIQIVNGYGPTENTTFTTCHVVEGSVAQDKSLPIGRAVNGTGLCVLDTQQQLVPMGCVGELYTSGLGLAQGYLNQPVLTEEKFPTITVNGQATRLYRTGDLVRFNESGELEFVGRADSQVKVRGFRIELGEVKRLIDAVQDVTSSLIITTGESADDKRLAAYVESSLELDSLRSALTENLPKHMMPSVIIPMDEWPLTANGKIDRKALPQPDGETLSSQMAYQAPANDDEKSLVAIWSNLLSVDEDKLSTTANFFDLGGHSLSAVRLSDELHKHFGKEVPVKLVFDNPTIVQLSQAIAVLSLADNRPAIEAVERNGQAMPLSFAQQRLWLVDQLGGGSSEYNMPLAFEISGTFNPDIAEQAFKRIIERHEVLRTVYTKGPEGEPVQVIRDQFEFKLTQLRVTDPSELKQLVLEDALKPFDLSNDVMLRASWAQTEVKKGVLLFNMHHIASDGWSMPVLMREFTAQYKAIEAGKDSQLAPLKVQYADYAQWQRNWLKGETLDKQMGYWQSQLEDVPSVHSLPLDKVRPEVKQFVGARAFAELPADVAKSLQQVARKHQLTPFMLMHSALAIVLSRHSGTTDIVVGTPSANRGQSELSDLIGFFVNTLVLRVNTDHKQLSDYFTHVRQIHLDAQTHQDVPFEQLVESVGAARSTAYTPLFQIMLTTNTDFESAMSEPSADSTDFQMQPFVSGAPLIKCDLEIDLNLSDEGFSVGVNYDVSLFEQTHVEQLTDHLCRVLQSIAKIESSKAPLSAVDMLCQSELTQIADYLELDKPRHSEERIDQRFARIAALYPQNIALIEGEEQLTYQQLSDEVNRLTQVVQSYGVSAGDRVGLSMSRSKEMVVAILAILHAGGAYVPLDPNYPQERLAHMVSDSGLNLIISQSDIAQNVNFAGVSCVCVDELTQQLASKPIQQLPNLTGKATDCAYVIYTSGTTGLPKGVMAQHQGVNRLVSDKAFGNFNTNTRFLHSSSISFDAAVFEIWGPLLNGGCVVLYPDNYLEPGKINQRVREHQVTCLFLTSGLFIQWSQQLLESEQSLALEYVITGGDVVDPSAVARVQQFDRQIKVINAYGPSENATVTSFHVVDSEAKAEQGVPIGRPISGTGVCLLDAQQQPVPLGSIGELYTSGYGLALGYLNQAELTAEKFPLLSVAGHITRMYNTGDLARFNRQGQLEFIGREDGQVKIRGFRIELSEVKRLIDAIAGVASSLITTLGDNANNKRLVAYVETEAGFSGGLRQKLVAVLPQHMMPSVLIEIDEWPLTANGKIDRKALPQPDAASLQGTYMAPETAQEKALVEIWAEVLSVKEETLSVTANFFELGGHSLLLIRLVSEINKRFDKVQLSVVEVINCVDLKQMALLLEHEHSGQGILAELNTKAVSNPQIDSLIIAPAAGLTSASYVQFAAKLDVASVSVIEPKGLYSGEAYYQDFNDLVDESLAAIVLEKGDLSHYHLLGHSFGGTLAFALALKLEALGKTVSLTLVESLLYDDSGITEQDGSEAVLKQAMSGQTQIDEAIKTRFMAIYQQQQAFIKTYRPEDALKGTVTFIYGSHSDYFVEHQDAIVGKVSRYCEKPVQRICLAGDHFSLFAPEQVGDFYGVLLNQTPDKHMNEKG